MYYRKQKGQSERVDGSKKDGYKGNKGSMLEEVGQ